MQLIRVQDALSRKFARQARIEALEYHAAGHCAHIGRLSPGCLKCFVPDRFSHNFTVGADCNAACVYCFGASGEPPISKDHLLEMKGQLLNRAINVDTSQTIPSISFTGGGEPLLYLDIIADLMRFYRGIEPYMPRKPWYYLYTNGLLADAATVQRLRDLGIDEMRFHLGATNFSPKVYANMREAVRIMPVITVETPAWPPHRQKLFEMLPIIAEIGVRHLNIGELQVLPENRERIARLLPGAEIYQNRTVFLDDGGLVYDIIEEVLRQGYAYSVLDCNCLVKSIQTTPAKWYIHEPVEGLCAEEETERTNR
ncbi:MAG: hypothetical protein JXQ72_05150 [Anaerolineae bacterium]|nr:hypothetical protein [Anaerolineae bacterium]